MKLLMTNSAHRSTSTAKDPSQPNSTRIKQRNKLKLNPQPASSTPPPPNFIRNLLAKFGQWIKSSQGITAISIILLLILIRWLVTTFLPIVWVEAKYRYHQTMENTFHVSSLQELILPDFSWFNVSELSQNREFGIKIPSIYLDEPVIFNVDPNNSTQYRQALKKGIAHASSTAFPDNGGVGYYFAHSSSSDLHVQYNAVFYLMGKVEVGDKVIIWHESSKYQYQVFDKQVTEPKDVSFLNKDYGEEVVVLQTCWPPGTVHKRLLVFARRVED